MEEQLAAYRARKAREQAEQNYGQKSSWFGSRSTSLQTKEAKERTDVDRDDARRRLHDQTLTQVCYSCKLATYLKSTKIIQCVHMAGSVQYSRIYIFVILQES